MCNTAEIEVLFFLFMFMPLPYINNIRYAKQRIYDAQHTIKPNPFTTAAMEYPSRPKIFNSIKNHLYRDINIEG